MDDIQPVNLGDAARDGFAAAVAGKPEPAEAPAAAPEPVETETPEAESSRGPETEAETSDVTETEEQTTEEQPAEEAGAEEPEASEETGEDAAPKGPIPYDRFKQVNEAKKVLEAEVKRLQGDRQGVDELVNAKVYAALNKLADQHPAVRQALLGEPAQEPEAPATPPGKPLTPEEQRILHLEKAVKGLSESQHLERRQRVLDQIEERVEERIEDHPIFKDPAARSVGDRLIAQTLMANPKMPVETVVDNVAKDLRGLIEASKKGYVQAKKTVAKTVPVGTGGGRAAPPAKPAPKLGLEDGSAQKALEAAMRARATA